MENPYSSPKSELAGKSISKKKKKPIAIWLTSIVAIITSLAIVWRAYETQWLAAITFALPYLVAGIALIMNKSWSQYIFYTMAVIGIGVWLYAIYGYQILENLNQLNVMISLIPGVLFVIVNIGIVSVVYRHFHES